MRTIFIGDVHGCAAAFEALLNELNFVSGEDRLLLTGDAFTRGADPLRVWELIKEMQAVMVLGNHDARMIQQIRCLQVGKEPRFKHPDQQRTLVVMESVLAPLLTWLSALPWCICGKEFVLVHAGINPKQGIAGTRQDEFLQIRTWPSVGLLEGARWPEYYQPESRVLIFGHDALGGLVVKRRDNGWPYLVGLDSGCVYGNQLSAYVLEEQRLVQV